MLDILEQQILPIFEGNVAYLDPMITREGSNMMTCRLYYYSASEWAGAGCGEMRDLTDAPGPINSCSSGPAAILQVMDNLYKNLWSNVCAGLLGKTKWVLKAQGQFFSPFFIIIFEGLGLGNVSKINL